MLLGFNIQKYNSVACSVALTNAVSMCDRTPKRAATFFWPLGAQTTATNVTFTITDLAPFVAKAGMVLGLIGIPAGTKVTVAGIAVAGGGAVALGGNSTTQRTVAAWDGTVAVYWQFADGLAAINGYKITIYNDVNGATGIAAGAQCGIGEAGVCPAVWIDHEPGMSSGRARMARIQRTLSGAVNIVNRPIYRTLALRPTFGDDADWRQAALPNGLDFEQLLTAVAADPYVLVFDTTDAADMQRAGLFGICIKAPNIVGLDGPYAQFEQFEFEEIVSGNAGSAASAPPITSDSTRFLRADGAWSNILTGPITVTAITVSGLTGYVKANGAGVATAANTVPTTDLSGTLAAAQMPALGGDLSHVAGTLTPTVAKIRGVNVAATVPSNGQALVYDSATSSWKPGTLGTGSITGLGTAASHADTDYVHTTGADTIGGPKLFTSLISAPGLRTNLAGLGGSDWNNFIGSLATTAAGNSAAAGTANSSGYSWAQVLSMSQGTSSGDTHAQLSFQHLAAGVKCRTGNNGTWTPWYQFMVDDGSDNYAVSGSMSFGLSTRQMINLFGTTYGIGVQSNTLYLRTASGFDVFKGGTHSNTQDDPGSGGTKIFGLDASGNLTIPGNLTAANVGVAPPSAPYNAGNTTASMALNFQTNGAYQNGTQVRQKMKLGANTTFSFTDPTVLATIVLTITNGATAYTATWPASVEWPGRVAPSVGGANAVTIVTLCWDGTNYFGSAMGPF